MKQLFTCLLFVSIIFSLAYFTCTVAQEGPECGPRHNKQNELNSPSGHHAGHSSGHQNFPPPELTDVQLQELMVFCKEYFPTFHNRIGDIKNSNPLIYKKVTGEKFTLMLHLKELMKKEEDVFKLVVKKIELEDKSRELAEKYKDNEGNTGVQSAVEKELEKILSELFTLKQKESQLQADKMEKEVKHMKEVITEREKNKDIIIKDGLDKLTGKSEYLEW